MEGKPINPPKKHSKRKCSYLIKFIFKKDDNLLNQFLKYITLGNISNAVDFSTLYLLTEFFHLHYLISAAISFIIGVITGHIICILWIFQRGRFDFRVEFFAILLISVAGLAINESIIFFLVRYFSIHYMLSKAISTSIVMFWNFFARKQWVYKK